ncbi:MAG TPA: hypothetical protein VG293_11670 [Solirubrobacteraceae bacterium]|nr:hypothetical protein [Solirubrobacteraceae bacterium]
MVTSAIGSGAFVGGKAATVHSSTPSHSISATTYVSAIYCGGVGRRQFAGQRSGVQLLGRYSRRSESVAALDFAGYYSYCRARTAVYKAEFMVSNSTTGLIYFKPARFKIAPGDPLAVSVKRGSSGITLTITDLNTKKSRTVHGPTLTPNSGWAAGALELFGRQTGAPFLTGWVSLINLYSPTGGPAAVPGPVPWAPMVFQHLRVNGHIVGRKTKHVELTMWRVGGGIASAHVRATAAGTKPTNATVTPPSNGSFESSDGGLPPPTLGKNVDITPVSGNVLVKETGQNNFKHVPKGALVPNGSEVDVRGGSVQMTLALPGGRYETGVFYAGQFKLHQDGTSGATTATLADGSGLKYCPATAIGPGNAVGIASAARATASAAKAKSKGNGKKVGSLWANAHGSFTTKGSGGAAAVLGTKWYTENTCAGTYFRVVRDKIKVTAYYPRPHTVIVTAGHSYFAPDKAVPIIQVSPVTTTGGHFNVHVTDTYRLTVISAQQPSYVDAAVAPNLPGNGTTALFRDGSVNGVPRWTVLFDITPNLINFQYWNVGVQIGSTTYLVKLRVSG